MTNKKRTDLDKLRTIVWSAGLAESVQIKDFLRLELELKRRLEEGINDPSGIFFKYSRGSVMPSRTRGLNSDGLWIGRAEAVVPGSSAWFKTPLWFLLQEKDFSPAELLACARMLPPEMTVRLCQEHDATLPAAGYLKRMRETVLVDMLDTSISWSLGGLVTVARIAELQSHPYCARESMIASVCALQEYINKLSDDSLLKQPLSRLREFLVNRTKLSIALSGAAGTDADVNQRLNGWSTRLACWKKAREWEES